MDRRARIGRSMLMLVAASALACASSQLGRAMEESEQHMRARQWKRAVDVLEPATRGAVSSLWSEAPLQPAHLRLSEAYRHLGNPAEALRHMDWALFHDPFRPYPDKGLVAQRKVIAAELVASMNAPAVGRARVSHRESVPDRFRLVAIDYVLDETRTFSWKTSPIAPRLGGPYVVLDVPATAAPHYLRVKATYIAIGYPDYRYHVREAFVFAGKANRTIDVTAVLSYRDGVTTQYGLGFEIDFAQQER